ncbi:zinc ribbon domain-containing protein [Armatimonas sp.]|uniref:zinc ribbon domain-containing protein n=1 Tax=Armatimonas sp. TaxID=1872638 RepID=UPI003752CF01
MLAYKAECAGRQLIKVNPAYTSQDCHQCKHRQKMPRSTFLKSLWDNKALRLDLREAPCFSGGSCHVFSRTQTHGKTGSYRFGGISVHGQSTQQCLPSAPPLLPGAGRGARSEGALWAQ